MPIEKMSASAVKKFARCPKQYFLRYIDGYEVYDDGSKYIDLGDAVHDSIEYLLKETETDLTDEEEILTVLRERNHEISEYPDDMESDAQECLETASRFLCNNISEDEIRAVEERWTMDREGVEFSGYLDLATETDIYDWKTGTSEGKELAEKLQAAVYIELYFEEYGEYPETVNFIYLKEGAKNTHKRVRDGEVFWNQIENKYFETVRDYVRQIKKADAAANWEADPGDSKCYWCEFRLHCQDSKVGAENVEPHMIEL